MDGWFWTLDGLRNDPQRHRLSAKSDTSEATDGVKRKAEKQAFGDHSGPHSDFRFHTSDFTLGSSKVQDGWMLELLYLYL